MVRVGGCEADDVLVRWLDFLDLSTSSFSCWGGYLINENDDDDDDWRNTGRCLIRGSFFSSSFSSFDVP